jgi:S-adenosyl-L-methionine hydrolase (adenosine-forming)
MSIITLTTDLGTTDFYLAAVKGSILSAMPDANLVDISHHIPSYQIIQAAFLLSNAYHHFPAGTVHLVSIDNSYQTDAKFVALKANGHYFIGPDNGLFTLFLEANQIEKIVKINLRIQDDFVHFPIKDILAKSAVHLAKGGKMEIIGRKMTSLNYKTIIQPVIEPSIIRGSIIHVDNFGNAISNISKEIFDSVARNRPFEIVFKRNEKVTKICKQYSEVTEGEKLCLFGITGKLEVAINKGNASSLLALAINEKIQIQFL